MAPVTKTLRALLAAIPATDIVTSAGDLCTRISAPVTESSRDVQPGGVFVARKGLSTDGHRFIDSAIAAGAAAIVGEADILPVPVPYVRVRNAQQAIGKLAAAYHDYPSRKLCVIGVTGTDGKTTTCHLLHSILKRATGIRPGYISTISADFGAEAAATGLHVTTPGAPQIQAYLAKMVAAGLSHCILEMTSHGLAQGRLNGVDIDVAALTNVQHEHLDYHGSWAAYRDAKAVMFRRLVDSWRKPGIAKVAIINADDPSADYFAAIPADRVLQYGIENTAEYHASDIQRAAAGSSFLVCGRTMQLRLPGAFNIANGLAALAAARALGVAWEAVGQGIAAVGLISGRMERIDAGQDFIAMVDFAHTPNALRSALTACRVMLSQGGRIIAVFGSAGLRDVQKRRLMAETSAQLADLTILTAEDPRTESLEDILAMMAQGCRERGGIEGETFWRIPDRGFAIYQACRLARAGDLVIVCGKGHEQSMCFGSTEFAWDDREALRSALVGAPLSTLPTADELAYAAD
ncbi:MAG: UDP-N-acetylmuramoyl-L-alanyl-D-glutamate--2,6-diaminopimelate ligase [Chloroflexi bacterium]|nr:UDP-N-acetylmuramoyl-L-alanyl-D-glutamate--2,6-diaminopimelate ligase [Chloroflexota bacterium]MXX83709.1 UDP-N-acetylmuramoyl-L-alanyl-D-glutamate--2,6-diaminopimelate ligase [Chloroflexota bacterium]MYA94258.1 UDP-N-acetylmuramoyl-L-alanyl-D-glutamate--2,6-diaminopimelate ligase [Chloroflexota bacterium]MYC54603.1 UDP-N-acetylmuramoyl-L-alanyl-D-glutamate--2,6-diaminopimelate ligase [Chloroflexota bacterium]MYD39267.1 UDP-N-acetylmuramoyl-L-alanyl-D-glutamate--2,6-diaminopimelate ligase [C